MGVKSLVTLVGVALIGTVTAATMVVADEAATTTTVQNGLTVAIDPETGQLRPLRGAESERLSAAVRAELQRAGALGAETPIVERADGSRTKRLDARYAHWVTARTTDAGPVGHCKAGTAYLATAHAAADAREDR